MNLFRAVRAVSEASGDGPVDWYAVGEAAKAATDPGDLDLTTAEQQGYADDVKAAHRRIQEIGGVEFDLPETVELHHRHHWIDANVPTFRRVLDQLEVGPAVVPGIARTLNTGSIAASVGFLANHVLGQYDPLLLSGHDEHRLYFVHPNIVNVAEMLDVDVPRFRRWIAFHEMTHAAEFGAAPWLDDHLESLIETTLDDISAIQFNRADLQEIDTTMTAVEGYAELLMDETFDREYADLRAKLDARRGQGGPLSTLFRRLLGLGRKQRQYERGKEFFESVAAARDVQTAAVVWESPDNLPTDDELDHPVRWLRRMGV
ncbi:zinc-dependent metalloprotease [Halomarina oriensis]|uniref:Coenzyme F420 biosynthesis-associated protein n=1 Tax=Halomarina oriensis TaxID=671145 RepID=A0A6B0GQ53_9EURY|nr:zinc-dependent metalloprotease [Halomarina oriensis]MWG36191.1 hypothetical protein [Halomarina oriensis]